MVEPLEVKLQDKIVYLVGTAHVSEESIRDVERIIDSVKPNVVAVELCEQRLQALKEEKKWGETEITDVIKSGRMYLFLLQLLLSNFQRRVGSNVGVKPGAEMMKAMEIAGSRGIQVALVDRNIGVTLKRALSSLSLWEKLKLFSGLLQGAIFGEEIDKELIEKLKEKDVLEEMMDELAQEMPSLKKTLVDERDEYIALSLSSINAGKVVAVLGAGHLSGVRRNLESIDSAKHSRNLEAEGKVLEQTEGKKSGVSIAGYLIPAVFIVILVAGFVMKGPEIAFNIFLAWILAHSILAAAGVALMGGHPKTILVAFVSAPLTPFHPLISVGMLSAMTEFSSKKPRVSDFTSLSSLSGLRDYYKNRVTRVFLMLLVADLCNNIASIVVIPYLAKSIL